MKISIIGPSGSDKSYLAEVLSHELNIPHFDLDEILFQFEDPTKSRALSENDFLPKIHELTKTNDWIIEGLHPIEYVFSQADCIIRIRTSVFRCLYQQCKRFVTNPHRRRKYGIWSNIKLSIYTLRQFYGNPTQLTDPRGTWIKSIDRILRNYHTKVIHYDTNLTTVTLLPQIESVAA